MGKRDVNMLSGPIVKGLLTLSIPIMIMNVCTCLFNIIDLTILKTYNTDNSYAVGAVGVCGTLISLMTGLVIGFSSGANVIIARNLGRTDQASVDRSISSAMAFSLAAGLSLAVIGITCAELFLTWINCPKELLSQAVLYFRLYFAGMPVLLIYNFCASILRASGDTRRPMIFQIAGGVVKVVLTYLSIAHLSMGVVGVALSTILSWIFITVLGLWALIRNKGPVKLRIKAIRFHKTESMQILHIGVPAGLQQGLYSVANVIITATVNSFGPAATTGITIANNFDGILYQICMATSYAVMPYVSQNIGSNNIKRAMASVWKGIIVNVCFGAFFGSLSAIFSGQLSSIMSSDPVEIAYSQQKMILISSTYFICGINEILGASLRAMGKPAAPTVATLLFMCGIRFVWVYVFFPLVPNLTFLYLIWPIGWILSIITLLFVFFPTAKKLYQTAARATN